MVDRTAAAGNPGQSCGKAMLRRSLAVLLATTALGVVSARAVDATWVGGNAGDPNEWTEPANWTGGNVPDGTATLSTSGTTGIDSNGIISVGSVQFTAAPNAPAYIINTFDLMAVNGAGVFNNSTNTQTFNTTSSTLFQNSSTASGGSNPVTYSNTGIMIFLNSSTAGTAIITNNSVLQFSNTSNAGTAVITNNVVADFFDSSSASSAHITNAGGTLTFHDASTAGSAVIANGGTLAFLNSSAAGSAGITNATGSTLAFGNSSTAGTAQINTTGTGVAITFNDSSSAGNATFTASASTFGTMTFNNTSSAANAHIDLVDTNLVFNNSSTAGNAVVTMSNVMHPGNITFNNTSSAGSSNITNVGVTTLGTSVRFLDASTAANATIANNPNSSVAGQGGVLQFGILGGTDTANAGSATIINNQFGSTSFFANTSAMNASITNNSGGTTNFQDQTTAGTATILNTAGGTTSFVDSSTAGSSHIFNQAGGVVQFGLSGAFPLVIDTATAGNSTIVSAGTISFNSRTTGGDAIITTNSGGKVFFFDESTGGNARIITNAGGTFDASPITSAGLSAGSIEGSGSYFLGSKMLTVGSNNMSTVVSGVVSDGGTGGGAGGSLVKVGSGTMVLTGTNTYTGGTTINAGTLQLGNGGTTGSVIGNILDNSVLAINHSNAVTLSGVISGSGALQQIGTGNTTLTNTNTYTGPTTVSAGILTIAAGGSITSNVTNNATFNNAGTVTGSLTNTGTADNTGTIANGLTNTGTVNAAGVVNGAIANNAGTFTVTGTLASNSAFANAQGATLAVGTATYTLQGLLTNSGAVTVANGATLDASAGGVTNNVTGTITVAAGGTVKDDLNNAGLTTNGGAYLANVATNIGTGNITNNGVWTGNVLSNTATINNNLTWTGTVSNAGAFNNNAGATVSGLLTNTAGTTVNNGALNGGAMISGGTLTGSGTVTNLTVSGGAFAPGNGTPGSSMTISGNLMLQSAATYMVQVSPATASFAAVGGTANINGTAAAVYVAGNYVARTYTIMTAAGGVTGTFNTLVNTNLAPNVAASLSYDANDVYLNLTLKFVAPPGGLNVNQQNVANTLVNFFNTNGGIPLAFSGLTAAGLTQASGELGTGVIQSSIKANDMFLNLLLDPAVAGRAGGFASEGRASQFAADDQALAYAARRKTTSAERDAYAMATKAPYLAPQPLSRWSVWGAAYGGSAVTNGNAIIGSNDTTARAYGVVGGADYKISPDALIGFALAGGGTGFSVANALGSGNSDLFQAGVFGRQNIGAAYLSAALAYGWQDITTNRTVTIVGTDQLQARFKAETFSARFEGGYRFATPLAGITPYAAAQAISFNLPAYAEQVLAGTGTFALNYGAQTTTATRTELGLRTDRSFAMQEGIFTLRGRAAWAHDYNNDRAVGAVFQTLPGAAFVVNGARADPDGALVSAGAEMKWVNGFSLAATFEGEFSGNVTSYAGKGVAKYTW